MKLRKSFVLSILVVLLSAFSLGASAPDLAMAAVEKLEENLAGPVRISMHSSGDKIAWYENNYLTTPMTYGITVYDAATDTSAVAAPFSTLRKSGILFVNDKIVWRETDYSTGYPYPNNIYVYDTVTAARTTLVPESTGTQNIYRSGDNIVIVAVDTTVSPSQYAVLKYDTISGTTTTLSAYSTNYKYAVTSDNNIVWTDYASSYDSAVYLYNSVSDTTVTVSALGTGGKSSTVYDDYVIVKTADNSVRPSPTALSLYDVQTGTTSQITAATTTYKNYVTLSNDKVVWQEKEMSLSPYEYAIYIYDITTAATTTILPSSLEDPRNIQFSGNTVVWLKTDMAASPYTYELLSYNITTGVTTTVVPANTYYKAYKLSGNNLPIVESATETTLYLYNTATSTMTTLASNSASYKPFDISGNNLVWMERDNTASPTTDVLYLYDIAAATTMTLSPTSSLLKKPVPA